MTHKSILSQMRALSGKIQFGAETTTPYSPWSNSFTTWTILHNGKVIGEVTRNNYDPEQTHSDRFAVRINNLGGSGFWNSINLDRQDVIDVLSGNRESGFYATEQDIQNFYADLSK